MCFIYGYLHVYLQYQNPLFMQAIPFAETITENPKVKFTKRSKEFLIIGAIIFVGLIGISTCLLGDTNSDNEFTVQKMNMTLLTSK